MREATEEAIQEEAETEQVGEGSKPNSPVEKPPSVMAQGERPSTAGSTGSYVESSSNALVSQVRLTKWVLFLPFTSVGPAVDFISLCII